MSLEWAREDAINYLEGEFSLTVTLYTPDKLTNYEINGLASKHHLKVSPNTGLAVNSENIHISFSEKTLNDLGIVTRDSNNKVSILNYFVKITDAGKMQGDYKIIENWPDETLGLIICILGSHNGI
jgi:hypothetical protein